MMASSAVFLLVTSVVAGAAALLAEAGLGRMARARRFAWLAALALGPALLAVRALAPLWTAPVALPTWAPVMELPAVALPVPAGGSPLAVDQVVAALWLLSALLFLVVVIRTHARILRERAGWELARVMGQDVYVSTDRGPAVAGMWDPWIVLPHWVLALPEAELRMVLLHEEEHLRAGDTRLLAAALALVALSAWNPLTWWQLRRLRAAMEVDCDRRVLHRLPDRATYGASLLSVAARAAGPSLGLAAFTERSLNLKRRILAMTARTSRWTALGGGGLVVLGLVVGAQACGVETPVGLQPQAGVATVDVPEAEPSVPDLAEGPRPTPFTHAPTLMNLEEVAAATEREYPPLLRQAGISGTVRLHFLIDEEGRVAKAMVDQSSGHRALDEAALRASQAYRFSPARLRDNPTAVWVTFPVVFRAQAPEAEEARARGEAPAPQAQGVRPDPEAGPVFTPFTSAPSILNRRDVIAAMAREYPPLLREAGVAGTVRIYFYIDEEGRVARAVLDRTSGEPALDEAALRVAEVYRFSPALKDGDPVPVWVTFPITFGVAR